MNDCQCDNILVEAGGPNVEISVEPVNETERVSFYNVTDQDWVGVVNNEGVLVEQPKNVDIVFHGIKDVGDNVLERKFINGEKVTSITFPEAKNLSGYWCCAGLFYDYYDSAHIENTSFVSFSCPELERIDGDSAFVDAFLGTPIKSFYFPKLKTITGNNVFYETFKQTKIESASFPELEFVTGGYVFYDCFSGDRDLKYANFPKLEYISVADSFTYGFAESGLEEVNLPSLKGVSGEHSMFRMFSKTNLTTVTLPELEIVGGPNSRACFGLTFGYSNLLESVYLPKLKYIYGQSSFYPFYECPSLRIVDMPNLEKIGENIEDSSENGILISCFHRCTSLEVVNFPKLVSINKSSLLACFENCSSLKDVWFNSLEPVGLGVWTDQFNYMLGGCNGVTVHFTANMEDLIGNWADVLSGFGGTNTTILYEINPCYVVIDVVGSSDYKIYVNGIEKPTEFTAGNADKPYSVFCYDNYSIWDGMLTGLVTNETSTFVANVNQGVSEINVAVSNDASLSLKIGGIDVPFENVGNNGYRFYLNQFDKVFNYVLGETQTTRATSGSFEITSSTTSVSLTPTPKEWVAFTRPNLTADGTVGGDAFAVWSSGTYSTSASRQAWRAVDGNTSSSYYWYSKNEANPIYEFYNPYPIKVASLTFYWTSASYCAKSFVLDVSNDGSTWTSLGTFNLTVAATATANINSANAYKYYRMTFTKQGTYLRLKELEMSATKYE